MRKITEERFCEVCGVSSKFKKVSFNNYKLVDEDGNPTLKISGFKKVNYRYDFEKNILK